MDDVQITETGGIRSANRAIPIVLVVLAVAVLSVAVWYLLSFSSTDYVGSFPRIAPVTATTP